METPRRKIILNILGAYFLILGLVAVISSLARQSPYQLLYACYIGMILIGVGILMRKSFIILSQVYILTIPLLLWTIDFIHWMIFKTPLFGVTDYFFLETSTFLDKFVSLQHLYTIPVAVYTVKLMGMNRKDAWKWSIAQLSILFLIVTIFSPPVLNANCVFSSCIPLKVGLPYIFVWFIGSFLMVGITDVLLNHFLWRKKIRDY